jgi:hypothetical protein
MFKLASHSMLMWIWTVSLELNKSYVVHLRVVALKT